MNTAKNISFITFMWFTIAGYGQLSNELYNWKGEYKNDQKEGLWIGHPKDTSITSYVHETYDNGKIITRFKWSLDDKIMSKEFSSYTTTHRNVKLLVFYENGNKNSEMNFEIPHDKPVLKNGKFNATVIDTSRIWDMDGGLKEETIYSQEDRLTKRFYYSSGELLREEQYMITKRRLLKKDGTWTYCYKFEDVATLEIYKKDKLIDTRQINL